MAANGPVRGTAAMRLLSEAEPGKSQALQFSRRLLLDPKQHSRMSALGGTAAEIGKDDWSKRAEPAKM